MAASIETLRKSSYLYGANATFIEALYDQYIADPTSVPDAWRAWFERVWSEPEDAAADSLTSTPSRAAPRPMPSRASLRREPQPPRRHHPTVIASSPGLAQQAVNQAAVLRLINAYRVGGHQHARTDPLTLRQPKAVEDLDPAFHGLTDANLDDTFNTGTLHAPERLPLRDILQQLRTVYTGPIGSEYMHIINTPEKRWIQQRLEANQLKPDLSAAEKHHLLNRLAAAEGLERYLHAQYVGQKRFSLEGGESLIPALDECLQRAGAAGIRECVIGMAHRGRLNVLVNIMGKSPFVLFDEFRGTVDIEDIPGTGDVKYHMGFSSDLEVDGGHLHLALAFNPSHLEIVNPVVEGSVRARQERRDDRGGSQVLPILIHGDAAFAGQGVIMESLNMSQAKGYATGGTLHLIVNNQIGFTTSDVLDARSTTYCTDVAKMIEAPIFHVNGDDPEAVILAMRIALDYRMQFRKDVVVDIVCYRRHGHNEADEPMATQPRMYSKIKALPTTLALYGERLIGEGVLDQAAFDAVKDDYRRALDAGEVVAHRISRTPIAQANTVDWKPYLADTPWDQPCDTGAPIAQLQAQARALLDLPTGFTLHPRVQKIMEARRKMASGALPCDWGFAETLAYATLLEAGFNIRLSGQDCERGTFFHRHAVLHNTKDGDTFTPLADVADVADDGDRGRFTVINSVLSEEAVLGFEYGFATADPQTLTIWEGQFGDFANGAQVVIDQFITSGEAKWGRLCGLTMFLPHGQEGQGPEHSSARLERYLQLCAQHNVQVCVPTTPAQMFHMLRRQMLRPYRKPLIVMTPKSLLRHKLSVCTVDELADGAFQPVIDDIDAPSRSQVERIVLCSGKVYFDLLESRRRLERRRIAIIRIEQLYPFPQTLLADVLKRYTHAKTIVWCQEEPENQGAWYQIRHKLQQVQRPRQDLQYAGRPLMAAPAPGYMALHLAQLEALVAKALN